MRPISIYIITLTLQYILRVQKDQFRRIITSDMNDGSFFINESMDGNDGEDASSQWTESTTGGVGTGVSSMVWATPNHHVGGGGGTRKNRAHSADSSATGFSETSTTPSAIAFTRNLGDSFDWGPITLSSISPISIVHGRPVETLQLMRTVLLYYDVAICFDVSLFLSIVYHFILSIF